MSQRVGLSLERAVAATAALQPISVSASVQADVRTYVTGRLEQLLIDGGVPAEAGAVMLQPWGGVRGACGSRCGGAAALGWKRGARGSRCVGAEAFGWEWSPAEACVVVPRP